MELIPYHSTGITFPTFLSNSQLEYLLARFQNSIDFIIKLDQNYSFLMEVHGIFY